MEDRLKSIEQRLDVLEEGVQLMTPTECAEFLGLKIETVYRKVSNGTIPYFKDGKKVYFSKQDIINNMKKHIVV